jgi:hypothetical protein
MKILLAIDTTNYSKEQLQFPAFIAKQANAELTAIFLENLTEIYVPFSKYGHLAGGSQVSDEKNIETKKELSNENIEEYKKACIELGVSGNFIRAISLPEEETIEGSRFAEEFLTHAQCAVLVMHKNMQEINEVFLSAMEVFLPCMQSGNSLICFLISGIKKLRCCMLQKMKAKPQSIKEILKNTRNIIISMWNLKYLWVTHLLLFSPICTNKRLYGNIRSLWQK